MVRERKMSKEETGADITFRNYHTYGTSSQSKGTASKYTIYKQVPNVPSANSHSTY